MALSNDQRALLRLLAQREEGYDDIAALLGLSVPEVRTRVKDALAELESEPELAAPPAPAPKPTPVESKPSPEPRESGPAESLNAPSRDQTTRPRPNVRRPDRRRLIELVGGGLVILLLVLFATGAVDIGGDDDGDDSSDVAQAEAGRNVTQAELTPPDGGDAEGRAIFGRVGKGPVLQVSAEGLEPSAKGESYTIWLYRTPKLVLRLGAVKVDEEEGIAAQLPVPVELLTYVAGGAFNQIKISLTDDAAYRAEITRARKGKRLPAYTGETVLEGEIVGPLVRKK